jgi:23S rRNA (pseudouridine1915-N3)-methyltransferase
MLTILSIGKLKEPWRTVCEMYVTRLGPFLPVRVIEIAETPFGKNDDIERVKKQEAQALIKLLKPAAHIIALHPAALTPTTEKFSEALEKWRRKSEIIFVIGGPHGLHESILTCADEKLSLSPLTFTHQMTRAILLEQLYRCVMREKGKYDY